jgi:carbon monoxide dehydrogenase subunit G
VLKKILIALLAIVAIFVIVVAVQPSEFRVERSTKIAAPAETVFAQVNDLHKWDAWSPWAKLDPDAKIGFEGPESGVGATLHWSGNRQVGEGTMTIAQSRPNELIKIKTDIVKPMQVSNSSEFNLKPDGDQTQVSWAVHGHQNFIGKAFCLAMNGKKMMGEMLDKGLAQLKTVAEASKS